MHQGRGRLFIVRFVECRSLASKSLNLQEDCLPCGGDDRIPQLLEPRLAESSSQVFASRTNYLRIVKDCFVVIVYICAKHFSLVLGHRFIATSIADRWFESQRPWRLACREATSFESQLLMCLFFSDGSDFPLSAKLEGVSSIFR